MERNLQIKNIIENCDGKLILGELESSMCNFSIDTRNITNEDTFIGLSGDNFNRKYVMERSI